MPKSGKQHNRSGYYEQQKNKTNKNKDKRAKKKQRRHTYWASNAAYQEKQRLREERLTKKEVL